MSFYDDASWLLIPSGIEEDIVFAQKPTSGLGDLTFTRASDATYTDASGVVRRSPYNLLQFSEQFNNAAWAKINSSISIDATVAPNGTLTADSLFETSANGQHLVRQPLTLIVGRSYKISAYVKKNGRDWCIVVAGAGGNGYYFNISNGTIGSETGGIGTVSNPQIQAVGNDWYLVSYNLIAGSTTQGIEIFTSTGNGNFSFLGDVTKGLFIWGAQLVEGTSALDYFPTTNRQDVPRIDFRNADGTLSSCGRLLLEPQRTNSIRNSSMVGAVAGTPGTLPTNWATTNLLGLAQTVVAIGTENGLPYIDFRLNGTANTTATMELRTEGPTQIAALTGQTWTISKYIKLISNTSPANSISLGVYERNSSGTAIVTGTSPIVPTTSLRRFEYTRTNTGGATTAFVQPSILFSLTNGQSYDFTIRIAAPQMELGNFASTWVPTTTAAVTRIADSASKTGVSSLIGQTEGTLFVEVNLTTLQGAVARTFMDIGSTNNRVFVGFTSLASNTMRLQIDTSTNPAQVDFRAVVSSTGTIKVAAAYKNGDCALYVNGVAGTLVANNSISFTTISNLFLGQTFSSTAILGDGIAQAALFPTRLTNAQLAQLTTL